MCPARFFGNIVHRLRHAIWFFCFPFWGARILYRRWFSEPPSEAQAPLISAR